jgi:hypothetical protein
MTRRSVDKEKRIMIETAAVEPSQLRYEVRYMSLSQPGRGYAFPCDASGSVTIDALSERGRENYLFARAVVGRALSAPVVSRIS